MRPAVRGREGSGDRRGGGADLRAVFFIGYKCTTHTHHAPVHGNCALLLLPSEDDSSGPPPLRLASMGWAKTVHGPGFARHGWATSCVEWADSTRICIYINQTKTYIIQI